MPQLLQALLGALETILDCSGTLWASLGGFWESLGDVCWVVFRCVFDDYW